MDTVAIPRSIAISAAGGCAIAAEHWRKQSRLRRFAGPQNKQARAWMRAMAEDAHDCAKLIQRATEAR